MKWASTLAQLQLCNKKANVLSPRQHVDYYQLGSVLLSSTFFARTLFGVRALLTFLFLTALTFLFLTT